MEKKNVFSSYVFYSTVIIHWMERVKRCNKNIIPVIKKEDRKLRKTWKTRKTRKTSRFSKAGH